MKQGSKRKASTIKQLCCTVWVIEHQQQAPKVAKIKSVQNKRKSPVLLGSVTVISTHIKRAGTQKEANQLSAKLIDYVQQSDPKQVEGSS